MEIIAIGVFIIVFTIGLIVKAETKDIRRKIIKRIAYILICLFLLISVPMLINPIRRPTASVRNHVLRHTPIGMSMEDVITVLKGKKKWKKHRIVHEWESISTSSPIIGEKAIFVNAGTYRSFYLYFFLVNTSVGISWWFDEDGNLTEVRVTKGSHFG